MWGEGAPRPGPLPLILGFLTCGPQRPQHPPTAPREPRRQQVDLWPGPSSLQRGPGFGATPCLYFAQMRQGLDRWKPLLPMVSSLLCFYFCFWTICPGSAYQLITAWIRKILNNRPGENPPGLGKG